MGKIDDITESEVFRAGLFSGLLLASFILISGLSYPVIADYMETEAVIGKIYEFILIMVLMVQDIL
jgi:hypothetical protein